MNTDPFAAEFLRSALSRLRQFKGWADAAIVQVGDSDLKRPLPGDTNSIAVIIKHMAGNMRSRWTEFLTTDGEKSWRNRDVEFTDDFTSRAHILDCWESGWQICLTAIEALTPADLGRTVRIRGEAHSVIDAIHRQMMHYGYHVGQIILIARVHVGPARWKTITVAPGGSAAFNASMGYDPETSG